MLTSSRPGAHKAVRATSARGFARRHLTEIVLLGTVLTLALPAADAADGDPVLAGQLTHATSPTSVSSSSGEGLIGATSEPNSTYAAVFGTNSGGGNGVDGYSSEANGVQGRSYGSDSSGVYGQNSVGGFGVTGRAYSGGVAVWADDSTGTGVALRTTGKVQFQKRSNTTIIPAGTKSKTVLLAGVTPGSRVLATVQRTGGYVVQAAVPANGSITIYINKAAPAPERVPVGYFVIN